MKRTSGKILQHNGWTRQFIAGEPRLSEAVEIYREAGFEVHLEPLPKPGEQQRGHASGADCHCRTCYDGAENHYRIIYTRPLKSLETGNREVT